MQRAHRNFIESELRQLIQPGSFASYIMESLAEELKSHLDIIAADEQDGYMPSFPDALYWLLNDGWTLDVEWFRWTDGTFKDDNEQEIPETVPRSYAAYEQMAVFGLSVLADDQLSYFDLGGLPDDKKAEIDRLSDWRHEVLLDAYQSLVFAQKLLQTHKTDGVNLAPTKVVDFSALGAAGAKKRHAPQAELRKWAVSLYRQGKWPSANAAAFELAAQVIEHGKKIGAHLSQANAQRTIAEWIRKSV